MLIKNKFSGIQITLVIMCLSIYGGEILTTLFFLGLCFVTFVITIFDVLSVNRSPFSFVNFFLISHPESKQLTFIILHCKIKISFK